MSVVSGRLQDMEVGKVWIADADALDDLGKRRKRVWHPHPCRRQISNHERVPSSITPPLKCGPRAETYAHLACTNGVDHRLSNLEHEACAILHRAAIRIC